MFYSLSCHMSICQQIMFYALRAHLVGEMISSITPVSYYVGENIKYTGKQSLQPRYKFGKYSINQITWTQMVTCPLWATTQDSVPAWHAVLTFGVVFYHRYVSQHFGYKTKNLWSLTNNAICIRFLTSFVRLVLTLGAVSLVFCEKTFVIGHLVIKRGY